MTCKLGVLLLPIVLAGGAACGATSPHLPMTATELARTHDANALALYLSQPTADPVVCDVSAPGPHIVVDEPVERALVDALREGKILPPIWRACVDRIFGSADRSSKTYLLDEIVHAYAGMIGNPAIERDPRIQGRLAALEDAYRERAPEINAHREVTDALAATLRRSLRGPGLGTIAHRRATEMIATLELERGRWGGQIVDVAFLDQCVARKDEALLVHFATRLPDAALRAEAQRRVIRLRIAASPYPEVREDAAHVEEMVLQFGANPVSPRLQAPTRAVLDAAKLPIHGVLVRQDVRHQTATLGDALPDHTGAPMLGPFTLRGALSIELAGLSRPITLCGPARELDPTPCMLPGDVVVNSPLVWRDPAGGVHFVERITASQAVELARRGAELSLPISIGGRPLVTLDTPLTFSRPEDLMFATDVPGGDGPALAVDVEAHLNRLIYTINDGNRIRQAVAERAVASLFRIVSRGGDGAAGADGLSGSDGSDGMSGSSASCPASAGGDGSNGSDGGRGGDGSDGDNGGNGGTIHVRVSCEDGSCDEIIAALRSAIRSDGGRGGAGGRGGSGGRGGRGGSGGMGATCTDADGQVSAVPGGSAGMNGADGSRGTDGAPGANGKPGGVQFSAQRLP